MCNKWSCEYFLDPLYVHHSCREAGSSVWLSQWWLTAWKGIMRQSCDGATLRGTFKYVPLASPSSVWLTTASPTQPFWQPNTESRRPPAMLSISIHNTLHREKETKTCGYRSYVCFFLVSITKQWKYLANYHSLLPRSQTFLSLLNRNTCSGFLEVIQTFSLDTGYFFPFVC